MLEMMTGGRNLLADDAKPFDPAHPDTAADFHYAVSPAHDLTKPDGD
jgi:hypothetical protein